SAAITRRRRVAPSLGTRGTSRAAAGSAGPARAATAELRPQALAGLGRGLECRAVALNGTEATAESEPASTPCAAVVVERRVGNVHAVRAHALGELDELLLKLGALLGTEVQPRERLGDVLPAGLASGVDL